MSLVLNILHKPVEEMFCTVKVESVLFYCDLVIYILEYYRHNITDFLQR